jgi:2-phosphoglycerate kinase
MSDAERRTYKSKLIVLRGNSGSGKTSVAQGVLESSARRTAYVEQDYVRRIVLRRPFQPESAARVSEVMDLIRQIVEFALERDYDVVLEGILSVKRYGGLLRELAECTPDHYFYYFDLQFEETVRRHATKASADEFGEEQLREWWRSQDYLGLERETLIPAHLSLDETVSLIAGQAGLG